jgi:energy-converting hydrogenase A subunit R
VKKIFISDCEGPISKNDNALELTSNYVENGEKLFTALSLYDDALAEVIKRRGHRAGATLKLVLPFLKACGVTDQTMREFSRKNLVMIANAKETLAHMQEIAESFIVSTSYEQYIHALCTTLDFPFENTYCTRVRLDKYELTVTEKAKLLELKEEITRLPLIRISPNAKSERDLSERDRDTIRRLDTIFQRKLARTESERMFREVKPVGGMEKAGSVKDIVKKLCCKPKDAMYVGDSITDVEAFKLVKSRGGLAVSFNGNRYAVENSQIAIMAENSLTTAVVADEFCRSGTDETLQLVENWNREAINRSMVDHSLRERFFRAYPERLPKVKIITGQNMKALAEESTEFRKKIRGDAIGRLG